uniref:Uncharacterized protein n=1 Tax=Cyanothece sp. (strain PCC 7425 / ATCC 29141) TaxID=395961 RepID=B8HW47_CYAP4
MPMRRSDRHDSNFDNSLNHPHSRNSEPVSPHELKQRLLTVQSQRDEWKKKANEYEAAASELVQVQEKLLVVQSEAVQWQEQATRNYQLYQEEQQRYAEANTQHQYYLALYTETLSELQFERRSKAGIKGWETRRKRENERLKMEIGEMALLLQDSLARKEAALENLELLAGRIERVQNLLDSVESEPETAPQGVFQKLKLLRKLRRIWIAIKEILAE